MLALQAVVEAAHDAVALAVLPWSSQSPCLCVHADTAASKGNAISLYIRPQQEPIRGNFDFLLAG